MAGSDPDGVERSLLTTIPQSAGSSRLVRQARLSVVAGPDDGKQLVIGATRATVGRARLDLVIMAAGILASGIRDARAS